MANTRTKNTQSTTEDIEAVVVASDTETTDSKENENSKSTPIIAREVDPTEYVVVRNGFQGKLVYKSSRTGESFEWDDFGAEQEIELRDLKNAKNSHKKYFINNWFMFDEDWIVDYLGVRQYYKNSLKVDHFDDLFKKTPSEIRKIVSKLSAGQKKSVAYRARVLIASHEIDSLNAIKALEESLGIELIER